VGFLGEGNPLKTPCQYPNFIILQMRYKYNKPVWRYFKCPNCLEYKFAYTSLLRIECGMVKCNYICHVRRNAITRAEYEKRHGVNIHDDTTEMS
jgi:hypothetical protein